jgi:flagellin
MSLGVLNNIPAVYAENNLNLTQASLQNTLTQLSSGSRINSGADDAAGLSLADGLEASATALTQSAANASEGVDFLQVADGALSQVTNLLNRAVTLATEASNGTLNSSQAGAANAEYQNILTEIDTINNNTEYNGIGTFAKNAAISVASASDDLDLNATAGAGKGTATITLASTNQTLDLQGTQGAGTSTTGVIASGGTGTYVMTGSDTLTSLAATINQDFGSNIAAVEGNQLVLSGGAKWTNVAAGTTVSETLPTLTTATSLTVGNADDTIAPSATAGIGVTPDGASSSISLGAAWAAGGAGGNLSTLAAAINSTDGSLGVSAMVSGNQLVVTGGTLWMTNATETENANAGSNQSVAIFTSDGSISQSYNNDASDVIAASSSALSLAGTSLDTTTGSQTALTDINAAISTVAADRGTIGANINTLTAVENVMNTQSTNTQSAQNDVTATDYAQASSNMSKYEILMQTGISALAQANSTQQLVTKLLQ